MTGDVLWLDGDLVEAAAARVSPFDHGLTVGDGVFETLKVCEGTAFALTRHLRRLRRSAGGLGLQVPVDDDTLRAATEAVIAANGFGAVDGRDAATAPPGRLRITVTGGAGPLGSDRGDAPATVMVAIAPAAPPAATVDVVTVAWRRNEHSPLTGLKTTSYAENVVALAEARAAGAGEAIFANTAGELCEGTGTNVFVVHGGVVLTPPLRSGCLAGITRELVLELGVAEERALPLDALAAADEAFLTSSTRDIAPVARVDGRPLPVAPGPRTREIASAFAELAADDRDP